MKVNRLSFSNAKNECDKNCAPNQGNANNGGVSLSLCICAGMNNKRNILAAVISVNNGEFHLM